MRKLTLLLFLSPLAWVRLAANDTASDPALAWGQTIDQARTGLILPQTLREQCPTPAVNLSRYSTIEPNEPFQVAADAPPKARAPRNGVIPAPESLDSGILHKRLDQAPPAGAKRWNYGTGDFRVMQIAASDTPAPEAR